LLVLPRLGNHNSDELTTISNYLFKLFFLQWRINNAAYVLKCIACLNAFMKALVGIKREPVEVGEGVDFSQRNVVLDKNFGIEPP
jgi:hypothetical protein